MAACSFVVRDVRVKVLRAALLASSALMVAQAAAHADDFRGIGALGGSDSFILGLSADGAFAVGQSQTTGNAAFHATRWSGGVLSDLGTLGGTNSVASGVSADGAVVVGSSFLANNITQRAFRWTGGVMTDIGTLGGGGSLAFGVSADGAVVVGQSDILGGGTFHAFRWSGGIMSDIGTLGGSASHAGGVSADGTVLVGWASTPGDVAQHAFRWTGGIMSDLGTLGGTASFAEAVSADGAVVIGTGFLAGNVVQRAFRWSGGTMTDLGTLAGGTNSRAFAVSADGSVVVGQSESTAVPNVGEAFRWKATTGMKSVRDLLVASGVNMTGWTLDLAIGVSADGTVIAGQGTQSGHREGWIARFGSFGNGLITTGVVAQSFSGQAAIGQTGNAAIGNALGTFTEYATQAGNSKGAGNSAFQAFGYGGYDSDPAASGTLGMTVKLADAMVAGVAFSANYVRTNMVYDGSSKMWGGSGGVFVARVPEAGLQWLIGVNGITLKGDVNRGYLNGSGLASSQGSKTTNGVGATARIGWSFDNVLRATQVTPFASYTVSRMHLNGYTETTGVFPAQFNGFNDTAQIARFGADVRYTFAPGKWVWGTLASAHKINNSQTQDITGTLIGLFSMTAPAGPAVKDWVEATAGVRWPAWANGAVTASLTTSFSAAYATTYAARVGVAQAF